ncbi:2Fe-2S iron-sulfur cluster-binding protein [Chitinasiproducens palmae]|uniref:2Fe-2S iron-sulfur cluster binding domain-containing protein n=1 Tax=Chitinasiproducens palmae TaxID=1770053 RepID=A0A1H2PKQ0_9BURK|nr:2Fe-2S iron-sulfur cluster-binding protein [Chitinasiproducens palmae]SDV46149.1 2Fe-2S iron-sulfur cluster binding domain-containing protein [Chitinasiproducens palmae]
MPASAPQLTILPIARVVEAPEALTLLQAALAAGVVLPSSCRNGTCRACLCRLVNGDVRYRIEWPGVTAEERREGWLLPCVAVAVADVTIEQPEAIDACDLPVRLARPRF